jgi:hypothetical protein
MNNFSDEEIQEFQARLRQDDDRATALDRHQIFELAQTNTIVYSNLQGFLNGYINWEGMLLQVVRLMAEQNEELTKALYAKVSAQPPRLVIQQPNPLEDQNPGPDHI